MSLSEAPIVQGNISCAQVTAGPWNVANDGHLAPSSNGVHDLGSSDNKLKSIYISSAEEVHIGSTTLDELLPSTTTSTASTPVYGVYTLTTEFSLDENGNALTANNGYRVFGFTVEGQSSNNMSGNDHSFTILESGLYNLKAHCLFDDNNQHYFKYARAKFKRTVNSTNDFVTQNRQWRVEDPSTMQEVSICIDELVFLNAGDIISLQIIADPNAGTYRLFPNTSMSFIKIAD